MFNKYDKRNIIKKIFGYCDCPYHKRHWFIYPKTIRMNSAYVDESSNWITCCEDFYEKEIAPMWDDLWNSYYGSVL